MAENDVMTKDGPSVSPSREEGAPLSDPVGVLEKWVRPNGAEQRTVPTRRHTRPELINCQPQKARQTKNKV